MTLAQSAVKYALLYGWRIVPVKPRSKAPAVRDWPNTATCDISAISAWWGENPEYNIGLVTGGGVVVVDLDQHPEDGRRGIDLAREWQQAHGAFPETLASITGSGGRHLFYKADKPLPRKRGLYNRSVDFQSDGALIILPPSIHPNGSRYSWENENTPIAPIDDNVLAFLAAGEKHQNQADSKQRFGNVSEGDRVNDAIKLVGRLRRDGLTEDAIWSAVKSTNKTYNPPLTDTELDEQVRPALKRNWKAENPYNGTPVAKEAFATRIIPRCMDAITERDVDWLLSPHIMPQKSISLLAGDGGAGKGFVIAAIISAVSNGKIPRPDHAPFRSEVSDGE